MFEHLEPKPEDPILKLNIEALNDPSPTVVNLSAGVYKSEDGNTPVPFAIKQAELRRYENEKTKAYMGIAGDGRFNELLTELAFGADHPAKKDGRIATIQTIGGSGALFIGARLMVEANSDVEIWAGDPTWGNHVPLLTSAGAQLHSLPYYDRKNQVVDFDRMREIVARLSTGSVLLLHGCCHNPSGADLSPDQWDQLAELILERNLIPFVDAAYHGLGEGLEPDAYSWRMLAERVPEMLLAYSCSKNFGLYRERVGMLSIVSSNAMESSKVLSNLKSLVRETYSMPAAHGAFLAAEVMEDAELRASWVAQLGHIRARIAGMRSEFVRGMMEVAPSRDFGFVERQLGMFSFLGITAEQAIRLKKEHSVYILESSRINVAGLTSGNIDYVTRALASVIAD